MATSLCFGLMLATFVVLFLVPTFYSFYRRVAASESLDAPPDDTEQLPLPLLEPVASPLESESEPVAF
jgi:hypothetical protein